MTVTFKGLYKQQNDKVSKPNNGFIIPFIDTYREYLLHVGHWVRHGVPAPFVRWSVPFRAAFPFPLEPPASRLSLLHQEPPSQPLTTFPLHGLFLPHPFSPHSNHFLQFSHLFKNP